MSKFFPRTLLITTESLAKSSSKNAYALEIKYICVKKYSCLFNQFPLVMTLFHFKQLKVKQGKQDKANYNETYFVYYQILKNFIYKHYTLNITCLSEDTAINGKGHYVKFTFKKPET